MNYRPYRHDELQELEAQLARGEASTLLTVLVINRLLATINHLESQINELEIEVEVRKYGRL